MDESGISGYLYRERGWSLRGQKLHGFIRGRKFARLNVVAAYCDGITFAEHCYGGTTTSAVFEEWFCNIFLPLCGIGDHIIMDRASFHNKKRLKAYAMARGVEVKFLPAYSPDYNPIEHVWANMKRFLRSWISYFKSLQDGIEKYFNGRC